MSLNVCLGGNSVLILLLVLHALSSAFSTSVLIYSVLSQPPPWTSTGPEEEIWTSSFLLPLNLMPLFSLELRSYTIRLQFTSLCRPCIVYTHFIFPALCGFLCPMWFLCPFVLLHRFLTRPGIYSSRPLYSRANPAPPSGPSEMS